MLAACSGGGAVDTPLVVPAPPVPVVPIPASPPPSRTISWTAPQNNTDGSALVDLAGFRIYKGQAADRLAFLIQVTAGPYLDKDLSTGTWYYAVTAVNSVGDESKLSQVVSTVIP